MFLFAAFLSSLVVVICHPIKDAQHCSSDPAITRFQTYVQIDTSKEDNLDTAVQFLRNQSKELDLPCKVYTPAGLPIVVITVPGTDPTLPSIMLNSHIDVVPAVESEWKYPPYSAYIDEHCNMYGRGTQDDKDVGIQYLEAVRRLKKNNVVLKRTLHITYMPDEETGGFKGMIPFIKTDTFKALNVGFVLDEGLASSDDVMLVTYEDRRPWQFKITVRGQGGHGYSMPGISAMEKVLLLMNIISQYRETLKIQQSRVGKYDHGAYTSVNINIIDGGYRVNVIPTEASLVVDMRLSNNSNTSQVEQLIDSWLKQAGNNTELSYVRRVEDYTTTILDDSNRYWVAIRDAITNLGYKATSLVSPATSDMLYIRNIGIPAVGFSPKTNTQSRIHGKDESLNTRVFMKGIDVYYDILVGLGNLD